MLPLWSPRFKKQSDDDAVSTICVQHPDKDFVGAQPSPVTASDAIIHTRDVMCSRFQDDS